MATIKRPRTKFDVLNDLRRVEKMLERPEDFENEFTVGIPSSIEIIKQKTLLKHELKQFDTRAVTGKKGEAIKEHWKRKVEVVRKEAETKKREDERRIRIAKKRFKDDKEMQMEAAEELSVEQLEALLKKKKGKKK